MADQYIQPAWPANASSTLKAYPRVKAHSLAILRVSISTPCPRHCLPVPGESVHRSNLTVGKFMTAEKPQMLPDTVEVRPHFPGGVGPTLACYHGGFLGHWKDPMGQVNNNLVGIPVEAIQTGQGAFAIHTEQTRIIGPDQISSAPAPANFPEMPVPPPAMMIGLPASVTAFSRGFDLLSTILFCH